VALTLTDIRDVLKGEKATFVNLSAHVRPTHKGHKQPTLIIIY